MKVRFLAAALLLCAVLICDGCNRGHSEKPSAAKLQATVEQQNGLLIVPPHSPLRERVTLAAIAPKPVRHELNVPATVEADSAKLARISPPLVGRVVKLLVRLGDSVKNGDPLFLLDSAELVAAQSEYLKAKSADNQAERNWSRQRDLREHGIGAEKEVEQAQTDREIAQSELERAAIRLRLLGMAPGDVGKPLTVRAPISGRIIELEVAPGQYLNDPAAVVMVVADLSSLWAAASVPEKDIQRVSLGEDAVISFGAYPGQEFVGKVQFIGEVLAPETRTVKVRLALDNASGKLKPGMFGRVRLRGSEAQELLVPASALALRGEYSFIFVEKEPWRFERRTVEVGEPFKGDVSIASGLSAGERVVISGTILLP